MSTVAIRIEQVRHQYGDRVALGDLAGGDLAGGGVSLTIEAGKIFALLGPNGGGKTTLFRLLSTLIPIQTGTIEILGYKLPQQRQQVRQQLGVVFQSPSLDKKLSVIENLHFQGTLYGLAGARLRNRVDEMLTRFSLSNRRNDRVETLSGGLRRRVELAKGLLHHPSLLLLDEPSAGLDPLARAEMWNYLTEIRASDGVTIVLTTHLLDEADKADQLAILNAGKIVAHGNPDELRGTLAGDAITIQTAAPLELAAAIRAKFACAAEVVGEQVRLEQPDGHRWITQLVEAFPGQIQAITLGKPTLEDVFIDRTGSRFNQQEPTSERVKFGKRN